MSRPSLPVVLIQVPLALASFALHRLAKAGARRLSDRTTSKAGTGQRWRVYSRELFAKPGVFPLLLAQAPRWNPHALLAMAGPIAVRESLSFDADAASAAAESWSAVVYGYPGARTVSWVGTSAGAPTGKHAFKLPPGRYALSLRLYGPRPGARLPEVEVDGAPALPAEEAPPDANEVYRDLADRGGLLSRALHFYVYPMLRLEPWLGRAWVQAQLLPVGNPESSFRYGVLEPGERLVLRGGPALREGWHVYAASYRRDSLPMAWGELTGPELALPPATSRGFYVIRLHRRGPGSSEDALGELSVEAGAALQR